MASSTDLADCVAVALGLPTATVHLHMRSIREEGILTQGGRGRSSARMRSSDAAALLLVSMGSIAPKDAVETFHRYEGLRPARPDPRYDWRKGLLPQLEKLPKEHTFYSAMTALVEEAIFSSDFEKMEMNVELRWPERGATIKHWQADSIAKRDYGQTIQTLTPEMSRNIPESWGFGDLGMVRIVTTKSFLAVAGLLR